MKTLICILSVVIGALSVAGQNSSSTFLQYAYGFNNADFINGTNPVNGTMSLLTLDHTTSTKWGGLYAFLNVDLANEGFYTIGSDNEIIDENADGVRMYSEIAPWINLKNKLSLEGQINIGVGFKAGLLGFGYTFKSDSDIFLKLMAYWRTDNIRKDSGQITGVFDIPLSKRYQVRLQGYVDWIPYLENKTKYGSDSLGSDLLTQVRILWNLKALGLMLNSQTTALEFGVDIYFHTNRLLNEANSANVIPQPCLRLSL